MLASFFSLLKIPTQTLDRMSGVLDPHIRRTAYTICCFIAIILLVSAAINQGITSFFFDETGLRAGLALFFALGYVLLIGLLWSHRIALEVLERIMFGWVLLQYFGLNIISFLLVERDLNKVVLGLILEDVWFLNTLCVLAFLLFRLRESLIMIAMLYIGTISLIGARLWWEQQLGRSSEYTPFLFHSFGTSLAFLLIMHLLARYRALLAVANARRDMLEAIAFVDPLTGLSNRRRLYEVMAAELCPCHETGRSCSFVLWDIDYFKRINDTFGHQVGDRVLREVAEIAQRAVAQPEWVGRWGGEEFLFVLPQSTIDEAVSFAEQFRQQINQAVLLPDWPITSSYGVTVYRQGEQIETTLHRADQALYQAKRSGRDRVEVLV
ncbi:MAG: hypothetical protein Fur005_34330 [Roseiflexaceae bacterium]